ncbi:protein dpy-30 homolog isoform X1 [Syngnathoides biaculeatus]|uniref:protein dpy-30 homolog isoform X1 n=1 Tax=Syngnathoides biaculeatus TaxID=300417 RepID=UPI002ADD7B76|nr:protein dpy-30 homolog isoform X1 [Syngnathoides biaculeatus]
MSPRPLGRRLDGVEGLPADAAAAAAAAADDAQGLQAGVDRGRPSRPFTIKVSVSVQNKKANTEDQIPIGAQAWSVIRASINFPSRFASPGRSSPTSGGRQQPRVFIWRDAEGKRSTWRKAIQLTGEEGPSGSPIIVKVTDRKRACNSEVTPLEWRLPQQTWRTSTQTRNTPWSIPLLPRRRTRTQSSA